ncbi:baseplate J/gp47 family protein [Pluralibacter gergoviae]|uniref:Baseplate J/gp47 family protein n=1 Tax=Pluralibacter gergoviae TaxID=61647 RepID=A0AAI9DI28_PLUGE|nr:baseplate J/gp47 family protein [Pluralibacter gergoviae]EKV9907705.1 baseplate J/gp47 family protein [Pluralibacter gergoviae]EKW7276826.1 baseplate J/gp47 family protein [Pluralibacter gergoviae]ELD4293963.1 baseplate J/gp47 family protein [Pluralibacter gergoviae]ELD4304742.1 baseplate J/gp47 family protein [Pluralibacter gergoviae]
MADINKFGATGTTLQEFLADMRQKYLAIDGDWNIEPESPDGLQIAAWCEVLANLDEAIIQAYQSVDPNSAIGQQLDRIAEYASIRRQRATFSTSLVTFTGTPLTAIPAGTQVKHRITGTLWATDNDVVTSSAGTVSVGVTCVSSGSQGANIGTLTKIATPIGGIISVTNGVVASMGLDEETDNAFRIRRTESVARLGSNMIDNIYAELVNVNGVKKIRILENVGDAPDENGIAGHSMAIFVDGGANEDIIAAISRKKNPGCGLNYKTNIPNKISVDTRTATGQPVNITFFRPEYVSVFVRIEVLIDAVDFDESDLKKRMVDYSLKGFDETLGFSKHGFLIGEDIAAGRLYTPANYVVGGAQYVRTITVGTKSGAVDQNIIPIRFNQLGVFDAGNIEVVYV